MKVSLYKNCAPGLSVGPWQLNVTQSVKKDGEGQLANGQSGETFHLHVGSLPTRLSTPDILALYPHEGASEVEEGRIPHIVLRDRTFPWLASGETGVPWVALLLFQVEENDTGWAIQGSGKIRVGGTLGELEGKWNRSRAAQQVFARPAGVDLTEPACWIEMSGVTLKGYLPKAGEAALLSHVRKIPPNSDEFKEDEDGFVAITMANRAVIGKGLTWAACLVSLRSPAGGDIDQESYLDANPVYVPVLHLWTFRSSAQKGDFESLARGLNFGSFGMGVTDDAGRVKLSWTNREGKTAPCMYHSPLVPIRYQRKTGDALPWESPLVRSDDASYRTRDESGAGTLEDLSYAAAFELGRLRALSDQDFLRLLIEHRSVVHLRRWQKVSGDQLEGDLKQRLAGVREELRESPLRGVPVGLTELMSDPLRGGLVDKTRLQSKVERPGVGFAEDPSGIAKLKDGSVRGLSEEYRTRTNRASPGIQELDRPLVTQAGQDWLDEKKQLNPDLSITELRNELRNFKG